MASANDYNKRVYDQLTRIGSIKKLDYDGFLQKMDDPACSERAYKILQDIGSIKKLDYDGFQQKVGATSGTTGGIPQQQSFSDVPENLTVQQMDSILNAENARFGTEFTTSDMQPPQEEKGFWGKVGDFFVQGAMNSTEWQMAQRGKAELERLEAEQKAEQAIADRKAYAQNPYLKDDIALTNEDVKAGKYKPKEEKDDQDIFDNQSELYRRTPDGEAAYNKMTEQVLNIQQQYIDQFAKSDEFRKLQEQYQQQLNSANGDDAKAEITRRFNELLNKRLEERYGADMDEKCRNAQVEYFESLYKARQQSFDGARERLYAPIVREKNENLLQQVNRELGQAGAYFADKDPRAREQNEKMLAALGLPPDENYDEKGYDHSALSKQSDWNSWTLKDQEVATSQNMLRIAQDRLEDNKALIEAAVEGKGFWAGFGKTAGDFDNWTMGLSEYYNNKNVRTVLEKADKGEELTKAEQAVMDAVALETMAHQYYAYQLSRMYKAGETTGASLPFMVDFMINPIAGTGKALAKTAMKWGVKRGLAKGTRYAVQVGARLGGDILGATGMTLTTGAGRVAAGVEQRMTGDVMSDISYDRERGTYDINYKGRENQQTFGTALWNSTADNWIENYSEMFLGVFDHSGKVFKGWVKDSPMNGLFNTKGAEAFKYLWQGYDKLQKRAQFHGYLGEVSEEYLGNVMRLAATTDTKAEDVFSADAQIDTWLGLAPTSVAFALLGMGGRGINKYNKYKAGKESYADYLSRLTPEERTTFDIVQQHIEDGDTDFAKDYVKKVVSDYRLTPQQKQDRLQAVYATLYNKQYADFKGAMADEIRSNLDALYRPRVGSDGKLTFAFLDGNPVSVLHQNDNGTCHIIDANGNESDVDGSALTDIESHNYDEFIQQWATKQLLSDIVERRFSKGDKITNGEYEGEIADFDGNNVTLRFADNSTTTIPYSEIEDDWGFVEDKKMESAAAETDKQTNETNGHVTNIRIGGKSATFYVKSGNLAVTTNSDGKPVIDKEQSDKVFTVVNAETGEAMQVGIERIAEVVGDATAQEIKEQSNEAIRQASYNERNYPAGSIVYNEQMPNGLTSIVSTTESGIGIQSLNEQTGQIEQTNIPNEQRNTWRRLKLEQGNILQTQVSTIEIIENNGADGYIVSIDGSQPQQIGAQQLADKLTAEQFDVAAYEAQYGKVEQEQEQQQAPQAEQTEQQPEQQQAQQQPQAEQQEEGAEFSDEDVNATVTDIFRKLQKQKELAAKPISLIDEKAVAKREAAKQEVERLQQLYDYWDSIKQRRDEKKTAAAKQRKAEDEAERQRREAEKAAQAEAERIEREKAQGVPDVSRDNAADARKRGYRIEGGRVIERQLPVQGIYGNSHEVMFSTKDKPLGRMKVVEAGALQPSHINGARNNRYFITEAQPKERTDKASQMAAEKIAQNIIPQQITEGTTAYQGAPVINTRGEVIQGNNRTTALRKMYDEFPEQAVIYKQYLIDNADKFGLNADEIAAMEKPVLTTELNVSDEEAIRLGQKNAQDTESGGRQRIDSEKTAQMLGDKLYNFAQRLTQSNDEEMPLTDVIGTNGKTALKYLNSQGIINETQYQSAFDKNGNLTPEAKSDLLGVLENMLFAGAKSDRIKEMFSALPQPAQKAILQTIARDAENSNDAKVAPYLQEAIEAYYSVKDDEVFLTAKTLDERMRAIDAWARQSQMDFAGNAFFPVQKYSNFALALAATFKSQTMATQRAKYNELYDKLQGKGANLFGEAETLSFVEAVERVYNIKLNRENKQDVTNDGSNVLAHGSEPSSTGQPRSAGGTRSTEPTAAGERTADHTAGTATDNEQSATADVGETTPNQPIEIGESAWGKVFQWVKGKAVEAAHYLKNLQSGYLKGVFFRKELGDIDLFWGNEKGGLAHIIDKHIIKHSDFSSIETAIKTIDDVISTGKIIQQPNGRIALVKDGNRVVIERTLEGSWVVTAFDETKKLNEKKRSEEDATRLHQDIFEKENGELVSPNSASSTDKDTTNNRNDQTFDKKKDGGVQIENEQKGITPIQSVDDLIARIDETLGDIPSAKVGYFKALNLLAINKEASKEFLKQNNITTQDGFEAWCKKRQAKLRKGTNQRRREALAQINADRILDMAQKAESEFEQRVEAENREKEQKRTDAFVEKMTGKGVNLVQDARELPRSEGTAYRAIKSGAKVMGWFNVKTGQVYIYTPNANNHNEVMRTLLHEFVSHKGLRDMLGAEAFDKLCHNVWKMMPFEQRVQFAVYVTQRIPVGTREIQKYIEQLSPYEIAKLLGSEKTQLAAADEYMAHFAEKGVTEQNRSIWQQIADAIRKMLRKIGFDVPLQDSDIARLLYESKNRLTQDMTLEEMAEATLKLNTPTNGFSTSEQIANETNNAPRFSIIGEQGAANLDRAEEATTRMDNLQVARDMEQAGKGAKAIRLATGWERGADGKWRYEIPDAKIIDTLDLDGTGRYIVKRDESDMLWNSGRLGDEVVAPELFAAYPQLKTYRINTDKLTGGWISNGDFDHKRRVINIHANELKYLNSILNHEIQHAIQHIEGFAIGGNETSVEAEFKAAKAEWKARAYAHALEETAKELGGEYNQAEVEKALIREYEDNGMQEYLPDNEARVKGFNYFARGYADRSMDDAIKRFRLETSTREDFNAFNEYRHLSGEVEARNAQKRMALDEFQRKRTLLRETEDIAREDQLFLYESLASASITNETNNDTRFSIEQATQILSEGSSHQSKRYDPDSSDDIRFSITKRNEATIDNLLAKNKDISEREAAAFKQFVDEYPPVAQLAMARWYGFGKVRLPEDKPLADQALKICNKTKKDPMSYASPGEICEEWRKQHIEPDAENRQLLSPEAYPDVLTNKTEYSNGIVVYDVENSKSGQQAVRDLMNDHLGRSVSPWCVLYANNNGELTDHAWDMWEHYNATQKKVALYKGRVVSFCASDRKQSEWWDLSDHSHGTAIPIEGKIPNDKMGRSGLLEYDPQTGETKRGGNMFLGNKKEGKYYEWNADGRLIAEKNYKHEKPDGIQRFWFPNGQLRMVENYKNGQQDGVQRYWYDNGQLNEEANDKDGKPDGVQRYWYSNGQLRIEENYKNGQKDGVQRYWYDNGQLNDEANYKDGKLDGIRKVWYNDGELFELNYKNGKRVETDNDIRFSISSYSPEQQTIRDKAIADGTYMKAPNGKPTRLTERQWLQVRTQAFKKWFGDWEKAAQAKYLLGDNYVKVLAGTEFQKDETPITKKVAQYYNEKYDGRIERKNFGEVILDERSVKDSIAHGIGRTKSAAFAAVPEIIRDGIEIDTQENWKGRNRDSFTFAAPVEIGEKAYVGVVIVTRGTAKGDNRFYLHEVILQENLQSERIKTDNKADAHNGDIAKVLKNIVSASENASKVIDENGEPLVVYHGTPNKLFTVFNGAYSGGMFMFTNASRLAEHFANAAANGGRIVHSFLNARNLKTFEMEGYDWFGDGVGGNTGKSINKGRKHNFTYLESLKAKREQYDGVALHNVSDTGIVSDHYIVFNPNQIKSATDNNGSFSDSNDDIRFRISNASNDIFYSNAERAVENIGQEKATPQQWLAMIEKNGGLKAGEDKWIGLSDWLKEQDQKTLTKQEIIDFISSNKIQIEETHYSEATGQEWLEEYQTEFTQYYQEAEQEGADDPQEAAWQRMIDEYGDDFEFGVYAIGRTLYANEDSNYLSYLADQEGTDRPINEIRLEYSTKGLENKREIALTVPTIESWNENDWVHFGDADNGRAVAWVRFGDTTIDADATQQREAYNKLSSEWNAYRDMLYGKYGDTYSAIEQNATEAELNEYDRLTSALEQARDAYMNNAKQNVLVIDEIQSNRHQQGREKGYQQKGAENATDAIPAAPFEKNWHELAMKRILRFAAENGYNKLAWTTGAQQAIRYDIGRNLESVEKTGEHAYTVRYKEHPARDFEFDENGIFRDEYYPAYYGKTERELFGKEFSEKLAELPVGETIDGDNLMIGGEGMKGFYDDILPRFMQKYGKKWGVQVGVVTMPKLQKGYQTMHAIDINDAMRESVMAGQPMFRIASNENALTPAQRAATQAVLDMLEKAGLKTHFVSEEEAEKNASLDTEIVKLFSSPLKVSVVSNEDSAKILKNLESTKQKYQQNKNFSNALSDIGKALGAKQTGSSQYVTIEAKNGEAVTIRISNHNATVSNFDNNGESNGISIVISRKPNGKIHNDGNAHIVEFFYSDKVLNKADGTPIADIIGALEQTMYSGEYSDPTGLAVRQEVNIPTDTKFFISRRQPYMNSGYTEREDGTSVSVHALEAEEKGTFSAGTFRKRYGVSMKAFNTLLELGIIKNTEWHHTGKSFKETEFYSWADSDKSNGNCDYSNAQCEDGSLGYIYAENKKAIDKLIEDYLNKEFKFKRKKDIKYIPTFENYMRNAFLIDKWLTDDEKHRRSEEHHAISEKGYELGNSYKRREMHERVDENYREIAYERYKKTEDEIRTKYDTEYQETRRQNSEAKKYNETIKSDNLNTDGAEKALLDLLEIFGIDNDRAYEKANFASMEAKRAKEREQREKRYNEWETRQKALEQEVEKKRDAWIAKKLNDGSIERLSRISASNKPQFFVVEKEEMHGKYGWFNASHYNLPIYYSGLDLKNTRNSNTYKKYEDELFKLRTERYEDSENTPQFLHTQQGTIYGWTTGGDIYLVESRLNANTPLHEYTHLWDTACKQKNPELWKRGVELMKQLPLWEEVKNDPNYADLTTDDEIASEVHSRLTGEGGAALLEQFAQEAADMDAMGMTERLGVVGRLKQWLSDFWHWAQDTFAPWTKSEAEQVSLDDFVRMPLADLARGVNPNEALEQLTEENADRVTLNLGYPSDILLSAGVADKPMKLYGNKVVKKAKAHGFSISGLRNLPEAVANPIAVFNNYQKDANRSVLTELKTKEGNFLVAVNIGKDADIDFNIVASVFGKEGNSIIDWLNNGYATYINKEKALSFLSHHSAPIAETAANAELSRATKVVKDFENPKFDDDIHFSIDGGVEGSVAPEALPQELVENIAPSESITDFAIRLNATMNGYTQERTQQMYDELEKRMRKGGRWYAKLYKHLYDKYRPLDRLQKMLAKQGALLNVQTDAYNDIFRSIGRASTAFEEFYDKQFKPLIHLVRKIEQLDAIKNFNDVRWADGKKMTDHDKLTLYLRAKDMVEAAELGLVERGAEGFADMVRHNGFTRTHTGSWTPQEYVEAFEAALGEPRVNSLWDKVNAINKWSLDYMRNNDFIDDETLERYKDRKFYVPQRGFEEGESKPARNGRGSNNFGSALRKAHGRESLAADPLVYMANIAESTIMATQKNKTKQKMLLFCMANMRLGKETGTFDIAKVQYRKTGRILENGQPEYEPFYGTIPYDELKEDAHNRREIARKKQQLAEAEAMGNVYFQEQLKEDIAALEAKTKYAASVRYDQIRPNTKENISRNRVDVIYKGKKYSLLFADENVAVALNREDPEMGKVTQFLNTTLPFIPATTQYFSRILTQQNPSFALWNLFRDMGLGFHTNLLEHPDWTLAFSKNLVAVQRAVAQKAFSNKINEESKMGKYIQEYFAEGAQTGFSFINSVDDLRKKIAKDLKRSERYADYLDSNLYPFKLFSNITEWSELTVRVAQYVTAREHGYTPEQAATEAKEVSTNFDRKGNLRLLYSLFSFFNAAMQGTNKHIRQVMNGHGVGLALSLALYAGAGLLNTLCMPDDPDDEMGFSEFDRMQNICLGRVRIPLPQGLRGFWALGVQVALAAQGRKTWLAAAVDGASFLAAELGPINPLGGLEVDDATNRLKFNSKLAFREFVPTAAQPFYDVANNTTFNGSTVYRKPYVSSQEGKIPQTNLAKRNVNALLQCATDKWFELGGGDPSKNTLTRSDGTQVRSIFDVNPSKVEYLLKSATGGVGQFAVDLVNTIDNALTDNINSFDDFATTMPVVKRAWKPYKEEKEATRAYWLLKGRVEAASKAATTMPQDRKLIYLKAKNKLGQKSPADLSSKKDLKEMNDIIVEWNKNYW